MKYLDEFRDPVLAERLFEEIRAITTRPWAMMEVCGGHTHAIFKYGLDDLFPPPLTALVAPRGALLRRRDVEIDGARVVGAAIVLFAPQLRVVRGVDQLATCEPSVRSTSCTWSPLTSATSR